jgi:hypothetical protein
MRLRSGMWDLRYDGICVPSEELESGMSVSDQERAE